MVKDEYVIKPNIAKKLLKRGYKIKDLYPQNQIDGTVDYTRCVFLFEAKEGLSELINILSKK